jgi:hypothetical protein
MTRDELDQEGRERLRRFLDESMRHPTPPASEGRVARLLGAVVAFVVVAAGTAVVLLVASGGAAVHRHTAGGLTPAPGTAMPSGSASTAYVGTAILSFGGRNWNAGTPPTPSATLSVAGPELAGITCPTVDDCWSVGYFAGAEGGLIDHYDGHAWSLVSQTASLLLSVACTSPADCWAVGGQNNPLIEHYDGSAWSAVASPTLPGHGGLDGVSCPDADHCWAVGTVNGPGDINEPLIEAYDGTGWSVVSGIASDNPQVAAVALRSISCVTATDCWAVGSLNIEHYDGSTWTAYAAAASAESRPSLNAVTCLEASDCWAVGGTAVMHYDGTGWSLASGSSAPDAASGLNAVTCVTSADCWAVGQDGSGAGPQAALILHWQGSDWTPVVPTPSAGLDLVGVTCLGPNDCWAVGAALPSASGNPSNSTSPPYALSAAYGPEVARPSEGSGVGRLNPPVMWQLPPSAQPLV